MTFPAGPLCTRDSLTADLRAAGVTAGQTLLVHTSLRSLGWVAGGAVAVVEALREVLGPDGTLVVPAMTGENSDPAHWSAPPVPPEWWEPIRRTMPAYDPAVTPSRMMGAVAEVVRTWPGARRSAHPQTSFAALGPRAAEITDDHALDCRLGEKSPLARLEAVEAQVLLLGADFANCSCFHLAEYRIPGPSEEVAFAALTPAGREWVTLTERRIDSDDFGSLGADFERDRPVRQGTVGAARTRLFLLADGVSYAERWLREHRSA
ncbi:aminoglycoside N(3)-acetyltransferase [Amycolatopsis sp. 195334CR]|uniref:aminoglycoside N(3)-acetyltransferase n=1 Tax=Amycolatopsis sp. 195334CR TaxID=2814588 RepID=UPI001A8C4AAE|nr:AAC(3) family N-acetyltransferase [Amycolatopsis sp. 195334CR]MBN6040932.1 AAC(3) family N-acetyltransferase [Amycolatopsis sp. 195334CR]